MLLIFFLVAALAVPTWADSSTIPQEVAQHIKDWPLPNKDYNNTRDAVNSSINSRNINDLGVAWSFKIPGIGTYGGAASNPLIVGDTVYFQDLKANVFALDLKTGSIKWKNEYNSTGVEGPNGPAVGWGKVFVAKDAYNMSALDSTSGKEIWSTRLSTVNTTGVDIQPTVYDGLVYSSTVPGTGDLFYAPGGIGIIYAMDQETGKIKWNFSTVDSPNLWGHPEINSGGGCWYTPSIDLKTGTMFWAIANPAPFPGTKDWPSGTSRPGPNLYTDSMMALNHSTGNLLWYNQVYPHDLYDFDLQIAPILVRANIGGKEQDIVVGAGKMGRVYAFNRTTGAILWETVVGEHNENDQLDVLPEGITRVKPAPIGGVETPMAYSDGFVYVPVIDMYTDWTPSSLVFSSFNFSLGKGELVAVNSSSGKIQWYKVFDSINVGAATVVNDLVLTATYDGTIFALKRDTGETVWKYQAPAGINGWPAVAGDTILWPAGVGGSPSLIAFRLGAKGGSPQSMITEPKDGTVLPAGNVTVFVQVKNFNRSNKFGRANVTGEGHLHYFMDVVAPTKPSKPAVTATGTWVTTAAENHTWTNVTPGIHNFSVELVNNDFTPLTPPVVDRVTVTINETSVKGANISASRANVTVGAKAKPQNITIDLAANKFAFDKKTITVPAGAHVTINFNNEDTGIAHNFALYDTQAAKRTIFQGDVIAGPKKIVYSFDAPADPGNYFFRCDVHPTTMTGQFVVS